jgi:hypothetical protein
MINKTRTMTVPSTATPQLAAAFGVSAYGQATFWGQAVSAVAAGQVSTCARIRHIGGAALVTVMGDFPGTSAWRPPIC